jgi:hypothetical protein
LSEIPIELHILYFCSSSNPVPTQSVSLTPDRIPKTILTTPNIAHFQKAPDGGWRRGLKSPEFEECLLLMPVILAIQEDQQEDHGLKPALGQIVQETLS